MTSRRPFCYKDPRFSYTLEAWRPHLGDARFVCVFRHPIATARSMTREHAEEPMLRDNLRFDLRRGLDVWKAMYRRILDRSADRGDWLFLHYRQLLDGSGIGRLADFAGAEVDPTLIDPSLQRSQADALNDLDARALYAQLCQRSGFRDD